MSEQHKKIAIIGATSHIAKGLILNFCRDMASELYLFTRSIERVVDFLTSINCKRGCIVKALSWFGKEKYDVVINCVGIGNPILLKEMRASIFELTETYDKVIITYLKKNTKSIYINFSSGAVYGKEFLSPADVASVNAIDVNKIDQAQYYSIAKLNSEAKHRAFQEFRIIDLRVFAYFSRFADLRLKYLIAEIINAVRKKNVLIAGDNNIVRDYIGHEDLFSFVCKSIEKGNNDVYDVYSRKPVKKFAVLKAFHKEFGLNYEISKTFNPSGITGIKGMYYSKNKKAKELGYVPKYDSLELLIKETAIILNEGGNA